LTIEKKINDLDYCYASLQLLKALEKNVYARNERIRFFQEKRNQRQGIIIGGVSAIFPLIIWLFLLLSQKEMKEHLMTADSLKNLENFAIRLAGLVMLSVFMFLLAFMLLKFLWQSRLLHRLKELTEKKLRSALETDVKAIDTVSKDILSQEVFTDPRVPETFMSAEIFSLLIRYFETGQASFMKEAVYALKLELENTGHYANLLPNKTLLQKEKDYLADSMSNLEEKVKVEGGEK
jgi:hypothetical protein